MPWNFILLLRNTWVFESECSASDSLFLSGNDVRRKEQVSMKKKKKTFKSKHRKKSSKFWRHISRTSLGSNKQTSKQKHEFKTEININTSSYYGFNNCLNKDKHRRSIIQYNSFKYLRVLSSLASRVQQQQQQTQ